MKLGELLAMRWSWLELDDKTVTIPNTAKFTSKSGNERVVYLAGEALEVLKFRRKKHEGEKDDLVFGEGAQGGAITKDYVGKRFRFFRDKAELPKHIHFHSLRHTYASWLVQAGVDLYRVKELCGHESIQTTQRYAHLAPDNLRQSVDAVFGEPAPLTASPASKNRDDANPDGEESAAADGSADREQ